MSVTSDIALTYRAPRRGLRARLDKGRDEARALVTLIVACGLMFVAQWPYLSRLAYEDPTVPLEARIGGALMAWLFIAPLLLYVLAGLVRLVARLLGGGASGFEARMALFWALLASAPLWLFNGLVLGFIGPGPAQIAVGSLAFLAFAAFWGAGVWEVESQGRQSA